MASVTHTGRGQARGGEQPKKRMPATQRRERILDAALGVFAAAGYHEASLDAVAAKAGISKALIYEHFDSKLELHHALLDIHGQEMVTLITSAAAAAEPGEGRLRAGVDAFLGWVEQRPEAWRMVFRHLDDPGVSEWLDRMRGQVADTIAALITRDAPLDLGDESPPIELVAPMLAQQLIGSVQTLATWWDEHRDVSRDQVRDLIMNFAWVGLERLSQGESWDGP